LDGLASESPWSGSEQAVVPAWWVSVFRGGGVPNGLNSTRLPCSGRRSRRTYAAAMEKSFYVGAGFLAAGYVATHLLMPGGKQEGIE
jgi:hypothetical protein